MPKISVLVPSLNVEKYISECLNSIINQTLDDIEILIIDAGSADNTLKIIDKYAKLDRRILLIKSPKKSYGYQLNLGIKLAKSKYIGIVEPDDYIDRTMFEELYEISERNKLDFIKTEYKRVGENTNNFSIGGVTPKFLSNKVINPLTYSRRPFLNAYLFSFAPSIWSSIYNLDFLNKNNITFNETAGASFQDTSFRFKVNLCAKRAMYIKKSYYNYRINNPTSSIKSHDKDYCVCDELKEIERFVKTKKNYDTLHVHRIISAIRYSTYNWNTNRLHNKNAKFLQIFKNEIELDQKNNYLNRKYFSLKDWNKMLIMLGNDVSIPKKKIPNVMYKIYWNLYSLGPKFCWHLLKEKQRQKIKNDRSA